MNRRNAAMSATRWLALGWVVTALDNTFAFATDARPATSPSPRLNVVLFYADDMGYADLGSYGNADARTPNLDRLAKDGSRFTQFYVSHCVCSPTRASLITGQYPARQRV